MARAKVVLSGEALSYTRAGRTFKRGKPQYLTAPGEINFYRSCAGFSVVDVDKAKAKAKATAPKVAKSNGGKKKKAGKK